MHRSKDYSAVHGGSGRIRNVPIKSSQHTIKMLNPGYAGQPRAASSYKSRSPSRSPKRSASPGSSGSLDRKRAALGSLPTTRLQKARKSAGASRQGMGSRLSGRHSARANAKFDGYQGAQYGRPTALRNSSSHANLGPGSATPMGPS